MNLLLARQTFRRRFAKGFISEGLYDSRTRRSLGRFILMQLVEFHLQLLDLEATLLR